MSQQGFFARLWNKCLVACGLRKQTKKESTSEAYKRLYTAMQSMQPGGWSDGQSCLLSHTALADELATRANIMRGASVRVYKKNDTLGRDNLYVAPGNPPEGGRPVAPWALVQLLLKPNPDERFGDLAAQWQDQMDQSGMALTWMVPNKLGIPHELYCIPTNQAVPQPATPDYPDGYYRVQTLPTKPMSVGAAVPAQWMLRFKYSHSLLRPNPYLVKDIKEAPEDHELILDEYVAHLRASRALSLRASCQRMGRYLTKRLAPFFGDDLIVEVIPPPQVAPAPAAVLTWKGENNDPLTEAEIDRIRRDFEAAYTGGKLILTPPGTELQIQPLAVSQSDLESQQGWQELIDFICEAALNGYKTPNKNELRRNCYPAS